MKEKPIPLRAHEVRATLEGRQSQFRRVVKPQPEMVTDTSIQPWQGDPAVLLRLLEANKRCCPFGQPSDRLWVRETWATDVQVDSIAPRDLSLGEPIWYAADSSTRQTGCAMVSKGKGRPSIHMPRWASRITLEVTGARVERLRDINRGDAMAEGCPFPNLAKGDDPRAWYADLWGQINGAGSWAANPWVWVVEFKRLEGLMGEGE